MYTSGVRGQAIPGKRRRHMKTKVGTSYCPVSPVQKRLRVLAETPLTRPKNVVRKQSAQQQVVHHIKVQQRSSDDGSMLQRGRTTAILRRTDKNTTYAHNTSTASWDGTDDHTRLPPQRGITRVRVTYLRLGCSPKAP